MADQGDAGASKDANDDVEDVRGFSGYGHDEHTVYEDEEGQHKAEEFLQPSLVETGGWGLRVERLNVGKESEYYQDSNHLHFDVESESHHCIRFHDEGS